MLAKIVAKQGKQLIELNKENKTLYEENKDLRSENEELFSFRYRIIDIVKGRGTIISKYDKIEELVDRLLIEN